MTTAAERQSRRRTKLNQIAQDAGFTSWAKYETETIKRVQKDNRVNNSNVPVFNVGDKLFISHLGNLIQVEIISIGRAGASTTKPGEPIYTIQFPSGKLDCIVQSAI